jgi:hypothetical protein
MKKIIVCLFCLSLLSVFAFGSPGVKLIINPGPNWGKPQLAAWITSMEGNYISTLLVSSRGGANKWRMAPKEGRPEALPVWNHARNKTPGTDTIDAVTSATPKGTVQAEFGANSLIPGTEYKIFLEANISFDYNDFWPKKARNGRPAAGVNGQPSLVYTASFVAGSTARVQLLPVGHGAVDGSHGDIIYNTGDFTSALSIIKDAFLE